MKRNRQRQERLKTLPRLRAADDTRLNETAYIPDFVMEGETFRTVSSGGLTLYLWEPALGLGSRLFNLLLCCAGLLGLSAVAARVGVEVQSREVLLVSIGAGIGALVTGILMLLSEFKAATDSGEVHILVGVPSEGPPVDTLAQIEVKQADEGKGRGAFAVTRLPKRSYIGDYEGDLLSASQLKTRFGESIGDYVHVIDPDWAIDAEALARSSSTFTAGHMNHSKERANVVRRVYRDQRCVAFYTKREIEAGEELLFDYGDDYWKNRDDQVE
eukprot:CAMPEP_0118945986 /NCGR_PEP_ID=MMETSP1169-20130426/43383_1 /TAXON_ID=36882 /ORGANISM="Pyramimonas obovata, Strain CCMP722" /LENGTH=271 /DNA_ID=CAMNT_0006891847 /DNA_START=207 /DNA_END=1022 /DNA_ORIENTATION=+